MAASPVTRLSDDQCWALLEHERFGRLATNALGVMDITPLNYVSWDRTILIRTAPGSKLLQLTVSPDVAFEIDGREPGSAWSVVLKGRARMLTNPAEIVEAERAGLRNQLATEKPIWVRIEPSEVSGRHFVLSDSPLPEHQEPHAAPQYAPQYAAPQYAPQYAPHQAPQHAPQYAAPHAAPHPAPHPQSTYARHPFA